jgi:hypothetical protein
MQQKIIIVSSKKDGEGQKEVNNLLQDGWQIHSISPMSGSANTPYAYSIVALSKM